MKEQDLFTRPVLYCIADGASGDPAALLGRAERYAIEFFQFRCRHLAPRERSEKAASLRVVSRRRTRLLINQTIDLVRAVGADGLHLPAGQELAESVRAELRGKLIGASVHSLAEALHAAGRGLDYLLLAPVFAPLSKPATGQPLGVDTLREVCSAVSVPVIALGGMVPERFGEVLEAGAAGIAGITLFVDPAGMEEMVAKFRASAGLTR
ncbi:MAG: thiamine phosphate synthase [Acidobacteria bacterium]|nr:thiamine phosphate synthase [Acidobacteriota bacterium]